MPASANTCALEPERPLLEARGLGRWFGSRAALRDIDVVLPAGCILGVYGPNGSGKTTLLRLLGGTLQPTTGVVRFRGRDLYAAPRQIRRHLGLAPEQAPVDDALTVRAQLLLWTRLHGVDRRQAVERVAVTAAALGIEPLLRQRAGTLSHGQRRLLCLARALAPEPEVLLLDEPFEGLDGASRQRVQQACRHHARRGALVVASHLLEQLLELCQRLLVLHQGRCLGDVATASADGGRGAREQVRHLLAGAESGS